MDIADIKLNHTYGGNDPSHFRTVIEVFSQNDVVRVRYSDNKEKNSAVPIAKFAEWAQRLIATPSPRQRLPNKHKKTVLWPGD